jgi:hypothetical protein
MRKAYLGLSGLSRGAQRRMGLLIGATTAGAEFLGIGERLCKFRIGLYPKVGLVDEAVMQSMAHEVVDLQIDWRRPFRTDRRGGARAAQREIVLLPAARCRNSCAPPTSASDKTAI